MKLNNRGSISIESILIAGILLAVICFWLSAFTTKYNSISHDEMSVYEIMITNE